MGSILGPFPRSTILQESMHDPASRQDLLGGLLNVGVIQDPMMQVALHRTGLVVNVIRDEKVWRCVTKKMPRWRPSTHLHQSSAAG